MFPNTKLPKFSAQQFGKFLADYPNDLSVLVVGDGNFAFSNGLLKSRNDGSKITASSLQTKEGVTEMYKEGAQHIRNLLKSGVNVLFEVDATTMQDHPELSGMCFDRIIFNFPHVGFRGSETNPTVIEGHKELMRSFFKNAAKLLTPEGEAHVAHQKNEPYNKWELPELANEAGLVNFETCDFNIKDYPGYQNKRGAGRDADKTFKLNESVKFKFKKAN